MPAARIVASSTSPLSALRSVLRRMVKARPTIAAKRAGSVERERRRGPGHHAHHRGVHLRRRLERARPDLEQLLDPGVGREHHREPAVGVAVGRRGHPVDDLLLQHERHVADGVAALEQMEQQRGRDVVGQVADEPQRAAVRGERGEIELERVALVDDRVRGRARRRRSARAGSGSRRGRVRPPRAAAAGGSAARLARRGRGRSRPRGRWVAAPPPRRSGRGRRGRAGNAGRSVFLGKCIIAPHPNPLPKGERERVSIPLPRWGRG